MKLFIVVLQNVALPKKVPECFKEQSWKHRLFRKAATYVRTTSTQQLPITNRIISTRRYVDRPIGGAVCFEPQMRQSEKRWTEKPFSSCKNNLPTKIPNGHIDSRLFSLTSSPDRTLLAAVATGERDYVDSGLISTERLAIRERIEESEAIACNITNLAGVLQNFVDRYKKRRLSRWNWKWFDGLVRTLRKIF